MDGVDFELHDDVPEAPAKAVDDGLGAANEAAAPLHEVRGLSCFARGREGELVGGAVGRSWGECCELQQLWVAPAWRRRGIAARLLRMFEQRAHERGCLRCYLETFSFQAPAFYLAHGYRVGLELRGFSPGVVKYVMLREGLGAAGALNPPAPAR